KRGETIYNKSSDPDAYPWEEIEITKEGPRSQSVLVPSQRGYSRYTVRLSWTSTTFSSRCNCPAAKESPICKHMVAAALFLLPNAADTAITEDGNEVQPDIPADAPLKLHLSVHSKPSMLFAQILGWMNYSSRAEIAKIFPLPRQGEEGRWEF